MPVSVPPTAIGLTLVMAGAATVTFRRKEPLHALLNPTYPALVAFVAWRRFGPGSFPG